jgi:hypothetical protein
VSDRLDQTRAPSDDELQLIREMLDPQGQRFREVPA